MNDHRLPLTFSLDPASLIDTLEVVLAIARRGNLRLARLQLHECSVALELDAPDPDLLALFSARLHNVIGIHDIAPAWSSPARTRGAKRSPTGTMRKLQMTAHPAVYRHVTGHVAEQVAFFMNDSQWQSRNGDSCARERAYGLYLGWRAFAVEMTSSVQFALDDHVIEQLIANPPHSLAEIQSRLS